MKEKYVKILYWTVLVVLAAGIIWQITSEDFDTVRPIDRDGTYELRQEELIPREDVGILIAADGKIYLYYTENELINVYTSNGEFLYGFQFPDCQNGISDMHYEDGLLYVDDRGTGIYVFDGNNLIRFEERHYQNEGHDELEELFVGDYPHTDGEYLYSYVTEINKIIRSGNGVTEDILQFPQKSSNYGAFLLLFALFVVAACEYEKIKHPRAKM